MKPELRIFAIYHVTLKFRVDDKHVLRPGVPELSGTTHKVMYTQPYTFGLYKGEDRFELIDPVYLGEANGFGMSAQKTFQRWSTYMTDIAKKIDGLLKVWASSPDYTQNASAGDFLAAQLGLNELEEAQKLPMFTHMQKGGRIDLATPNPDQIHIEDIAYCLSKRYRFNCVSNITVGIHSLVAVEECRRRGGSPAQQMCLLLHDAPEAYISDFIRPLKRQFPFYTVLEARWERAIFDKFIYPGYVADYKQIDDYMLATEIYHQFKDSRTEWTCIPINDERTNHYYTEYARQSAFAIEVMFRAEYDSLQRLLRSNES